MSANDRSASPRAERLAHARVAEDLHLLLALAVVGDPVSAPRPGWQASSVTPGPRPPMISISAAGVIASGIGAPCVVWPYRSPQ